MVQFVGQKIRSEEMWNLCYILLSHFGIVCHFCFIHRRFAGAPTDKWVLKYAGSMVYSWVKAPLIPSIMTILIVFMKTSDWLLKAWCTTSCTVSRNNLLSASISFSSNSEIFGNGFFNIILFQDMPKDSKHLRYNSFVAFPTSSLYSRVNSSSFTLRTSFNMLMIVVPLGMTENMSA